MISGVYGEPLHYDTIQGELGLTEDRYCRVWARPEIVGTERMNILS